MKEKKKKIIERKSFNYIDYMKKMKKISRGAKKHAFLAIKKAKNIYIS